MSTSDLYGDDRPFHIARFVDDRGRVSPWCYAKPRALPARARWTQRYETVPRERVCAKCLAAKESATD